MLLPHLKGQIPFGTVVVNNTALSANHVKTKFGFTRTRRLTTRNCFEHGSPVHRTAAAAAVLIATRHHLHAPIVLAALAANRHVFVEKPLCLTRAMNSAEIDAVAGEEQRVPFRSASIAASPRPAWN